MSEEWVRRDHRGELSSTRQKVGDQKDVQGEEYSIHPVHPRELIMRRQCRQATKVTPQNRNDDDDDKFKEKW